MKNLVYAACAVGGLALASGCVITTGDDADLDVIWTVDGQFDDGDGCATLGAADVEVVSERVATGQREIDIYSCGAGGNPPNEPIRLRLGNYDVWANARDSQGRILGQSLTVEVDLTRSGQIAELPELAFRNGQFEATWQITHEASNQAETCAEVGAGGVSILSTLSGSGGTGFDDIFDCPANSDEGSVVTAPLPLGDYTVSISILESGSDAALGVSQPRDGTISRHATVEDLGVFEFLF